MKLDLRIRGTNEDVSKFVEMMRVSIPNNVISVSKAYP